MDIEERIREFTQQEMKRLSKQAEQPDTNEAAETLDIYQQTQDKLRDNASKAFPKGSSQIVNYAVAQVVEGAGAEGLAHAYKEAREDDSELRERGERDRADLVKKQYMQEHFLPALEIVINSASPDELLNNKRALDTLDQYVLSEGAGKGYTASYVRSAYGNQLGQVEGRSDAYMKSKMRELNMMLDKGNVREAYGLARKLKEQIEKGEHMVDDIDFNLLGRIVAYYG